MMLRNCLVSALVLVAGSAPVVAQSSSSSPSLAELAQQEAARRQAAGKATRVYTNADLKGGRPLTTGAARPAEVKPDAPTGQEPAAGSKDVSGTAADKAAEVVAKRMLDLREQLSKNRLAAEKIQGQLDELNNAIINSFDAVEREALVKDRDSALSTYQRLGAEAEGVSRTLSDLEAEARKAAPPPPR